ncbi:MAG: ADP-ribosylglycohydrolase family protein [Planctomycetes bacterium]|nr:ADP-ribosylglycohydrolase family protein [Planctomycetota bacterium]
MFSPEDLIQLLRAEIAQRREEGCHVDAITSLVRRAGKDPDRLQAVYDRLMSLKPAPRLDAAEPSDLPGIRARRPQGPRRMRSRLSKNQLRDRLRGAMLARCVGCMLGKPVEGWSREVIRSVLVKDGEFPLNDYFPESTVRRTKQFRHPFGLKYCTRGNFTCMERDDDIDYTILGVHYLRTHGPRFNTRDVASEWLRRLPYHQVYTAERAAYRNLIASLPIEQAPIYRNPYREWIGAQIRADGFGYCAAGLPQLAAEYAWRDAALSHVKNGIYGEMLFAAMIAAAPFCTDIMDVIEIGLSEIPAESRLTQAVRDVMGWARANRDWTDTCDAIHAKYGHYHQVHTINNAALVIMGLLHGKLDLGRTICMTVMGGWDTDCTGATAGSVLGAMLGAEALPGRWIRPLHNRLRSIVVGYDNLPITDVADMALEFNLRLRRGGRP